MNKRMLMNFMKDKLILTLLHFLSSFLILYFYHLTTHQVVEVIYPMLIAIYIYLFLMLIEGIRYFRFNTNLKKSIKNPHYDMKASTYEQRAIENMIHHIHQQYIQEINHLRIEHQQQKRFLSQWIHNLKSPIAVIDLMTQEASKVPKEALENISEEIQILNTRVEQLLSIMRLDDFAKDFVPEPINLGEELKQIINGLKHQFVYHQVFPIVAFNENCNVLSDRKWHRTMIEQIISNAIKYSKTDKTSKKIYFDVEQKETNMILHIRDEGMGIPEHDLSRIFEPFFTGQNGRLVEGATGIGLYIVNNIAKNLGHQLSIKSEVGKGTEVIITYLSKL